MTSMSGANPPGDAVKRVHGLRPGDAGRESPHTPGLPEREHHAGPSLVRDMAEKKQDSEPDSQGGTAPPDP